MIYTGFVHEVWGVIGGWKLLRFVTPYAEGRPAYQVDVITARTPGAINIRSEVTLDGWHASLGRVDAAGDATLCSHAAVVDAGSPDVVDVEEAGFDGDEEAAPKVRVDDGAVVVMLWGSVSVDLDSSSTVCVLYQLSFGGVVEMEVDTAPHPTMHGTELGAKGGLPSRVMSSQITGLGARRGPGARLRGGEGRGIIGVYIYPYRAIPFFFLFTFSYTLFPPCSSCARYAVLPTWFGLYGWVGF
ncbi:hypothetical protein GGR54DRAFT_43958 [Hypoxylon sp. NC1633]|nr:hypothetical protein GGR54DRAFT_43958 [Hypoxylon sp. NC1633]